MFLTKNKQRGLFGALSAVPLMIALLTACSAADGGSDTSGAGDGEKPTSSRKSFEDWQLAFAQCMRDEGLDVADPGKGGLGGLQDSSDAAALEKASTKCRGKLGDPPPAPGVENKSDEQLQEEALKSAKCFRDNGLDVPDPQKGEIGLTIPQDAPKDLIAKCAPNSGLSVGGVRPNV
ncbi:hypothetical protein ACWDAO_07835 [Streptomyces sp. NPDC001212]|uniref:hypothetical protein n=1 Tax=Streptomyces sp. HYC2 TaxID=2955207 RepID=UPI002480070D|nr:hypothetical protein [Streptomyces sp. HYC2]